MVVKYDCLRKYMESKGYSVNEYDPCVFHKVQGENISNTLIHVDNIFIFNTSNQNLALFISQIENGFSHTGEIKIQRGNQIEYLRILFIFEGITLIIDTRDYLKKLLKEYDVRGEANKPGKQDLFELGEEELVDEESKKLFYLVVYKLLYLAKKGRLDILVTVSYLTSRVNKPVRNDMDKMWRVLRYLNKTQNDMMRIEIERDGYYIIIRQSIDAAYAINPDIKSQSGSWITMGKGTISAKSSKQRINSNSSTAAEVIALSDFVGDGVWIKNLLLSLGMKVKGVYVEQDIRRPEDRNTSL